VSRSALVFGAGGQDGHYLCQLLRADGVEAVPVSRASGSIRGDVSKRAEVDELMRAHAPDYVFHLAARSSTRHDAGFENHETISTGTLNVLESAYRHRPSARVFITGSGVQFRNTGEPIDESAPFEASSLYAVARIQSVYAARYYRSLGLRATVGYLFHHESPLRKAGHMSMLIAQAARRIAAGSDEKLEIGDSSVVKEWTFAGDVARGIWTLVQQDEIAEAVIGSGEGHSIADWLERCFSLVGRSWRDHVTLRTGFAAEYNRLVSRPTRMRALGWSPTVSFDELAAMMMKSSPAP
jgi:GDPmannose 4,6-dehydratase